MSPKRRFEVLVKPGSREDSVSEQPGSPGLLVVRVKAAPREGEANRALVKLLARRLGLRQSDIAITRGRNTRRKVIEIKSRD